MKTSIEVNLSEDELEELLRRARGLLVAHREGLSDKEGRGRPPRFSPSK